MFGEKPLMKTSELDQLQATIHHRALTPTERKRLGTLLAENAAQRASWEEEDNLSRLLARLPDAPLASNFTAQVLEAVNRSEQIEARRSSWRDWIPRMRPSIAWGVAVVFLVSLSLFVLLEQNSQRAHMASSLAKITEGVNATAQAAQLPPVEVLQNFEAIDHLRRARWLPDEELLVALSPPDTP